MSYQKRYPADQSINDSVIMSNHIKSPPANKSNPNHINFKLSNSISINSVNKRPITEEYILSLLNTVSIAPQKILILNPEHAIIEFASEEDTINAITLFAEAQKPTQTTNASNTSTINSASASNKQPQFTVTRHEHKQQPHHHILLQASNISSHYPSSQQHAYASQHNASGGSSGAPPPPPTHGHPHLHHDGIHYSATNLSADRGGAAPGHASNSPQAAAALMQLLAGWSPAAAANTTNAINQLYNSSPALFGSSAGHNFPPSSPNAFSGPISWSPVPLHEEQLTNHQMAMAAFAAAAAAAAVSNMAAHHHHHPSSNASTTHNTSYNSRSHPPQPNYPAYQQYHNQAGHPPPVGSSYPSNSNNSTAYNVDAAPFISRRMVVMNESTQPPAAHSASGATSTLPHLSSANNSVLGNSQLPPHPSSMLSASSASKQPAQQMMRRPTTRSSSSVMSATSSLHNPNIISPITGARNPVLLMQTNHPSLSSSDRTAMRGANTIGAVLSSQQHPGAAVVLGGMNRDDASSVSSSCSNHQTSSEVRKFTCKYEIPIPASRKEFGVARRLIGSRGHHMKRIVAQTNAKLRLRGIGSGYLEGPQRKEAPDPLHICISCPSIEGYDLACRLVEELLHQVCTEFEAWCKTPAGIRSNKAAVARGEPDITFPLPAFKRREHIIYSRGNNGNQAQDDLDNEDEFGRSERNVVVVLDDAGAPVVLTTSNVLPSSLLNTTDVKKDNLTLRRHSSAEYSYGRNNDNDVLYSMIVPDFSGLNPTPQSYSTRTAAANRPQSFADVVASSSNLHHSSNHPTSGANKVVVGVRHASTSGKGVSDAMNNQRKWRLSQQDSNATTTSASDDLGRVSRNSMQSSSRGATGNNSILLLSGNNGVEGVIIPKNANNLLINTNEMGGTNLYSPSPLLPPGLQSSHGGTGTLLSDQQQSRNMLSSTSSSCSSSSSLNSGSIENNQKVNLKNLQQHLTTPPGWSPIPLLNQDDNNGTTTFALKK